MPWQTGNKSVGTSNIQLLPPAVKRRSIHIYNNSSGNIFVFPNNEQGTTNGYPIPTATELVLLQCDGHDTQSEYLTVGDGAGLDIRTMEHFERGK